MMPLLTTTAFLHSVMIQEKKRMLKIWNMVLIIMTFCLSIFGTFITRSGVISSVHSFTKSSLGPWFAGFWIATIMVSVALLVFRLPQLRTENSIESLLSRESAFMFNNILFFALCAFVLATIALEFHRGARARMKTAGESFIQGLVSLVGRNKRRYGGYLVHVGMVMIFVGITGSAAFQQEAVANLKRGESF